MPGRIQTPVNQRLLTNVAILRYKAKGKMFELAVYPNKQKSYLTGGEQDLSTFFFPFSLSWQLFLTFFAFRSTILQFASFFGC